MIYVKQEKLYLSLSNLISKNKLIKLPYLQLLAVFTAICYSQCLIKALLHGKMLYHEMRALWCSRDSVYNSLKKAERSLSDHCFRFLKISRCFDINWQDLSEKRRINCFNIKSEVIIIYSIYEHILYSLIHTPQKLCFT